MGIMHNGVYKRIKEEESLKGFCVWKAVFPFGPKEESILCKKAQNT